MSWAAQPEAGHEGALRLMARAALLAGPALARLLVLPVAAWFFLLDAPARAASRGFLARVLPHPPGPADTWRHIHSFATSILDRVFLLGGRHAEVEVTGLDGIDRLARAGQGCILLGAHLGGFEALRVLARRAPVPVRALMFRDNEGPLTRVLERLDPAIRDAVIPIGRPHAMLEVRECLARGGMVGMLADRTPHGERTVRVPFLGTPAAFPAGPFVVAAVLDAPVFLFSAVRTAPGRYRVSFEPFAERIVLRRAHRQADLHAVVARFAARLEPKCRQHPYEWFNFFPFWQQDPDLAPVPPPVPPSVPGAAPARLARLGAAD